MALLSLLRESLEEPSVYLRIGHENPRPELQSLSLVAANYGLPARNLGAVSVVGPVRMDYPRAIQVHEAPPSVEVRGRGVRRVRSDPYELGVPRDADDKQIKKAFRALARNRT